MNKEDNQKGSADASEPSAGAWGPSSDNQSGQRGGRGRGRFLFPKGKTGRGCPQTPGADSLAPVLSSQGQGRGRGGSQSRDSGRGAMQHQLHRERSPSPSQPSAAVPAISLPGRGRSRTLFQGQERGDIAKQSQQSQHGQAQQKLPPYFATRTSHEQKSPKPAETPASAWGNITPEEAFPALKVKQKREQKGEQMFEQKSDQKAGQSALMFQDQPPQQLSPQPGTSQQQRPSVKSPNSRSTDITSKKMKTLTVANEPPKPVAIPSLAPMNICQNKGAGTLGRKVRIETNYMALIIEKIIDNAYHYDITIEPNTPKRLLKFAFDEFRKANFPNEFIAFDGQKSAYSTALLDLSKPIQREVTVTDYETEQQRKYIVAIKEVRDNVIDLRCLKTYQKARQFDAPVRALQCIDVVLKDAYQLSNGVQVGRSFFTRPDRPYNLGDFYELWTGLFQSTVLGRIPYVNVDVAHKAFPQPLHVMDVIAGSCRGGLTESTTLDNWVTTILLKHLKGLRVIYKMPGSDASKKSYKFLDLAHNSKQEMFVSDGRTISVYDYFRSRNYTIKYPKLPCLKVGSSLRSISLPPELCEIPPGQAVKKKCTEIQTSNMIRQAATSTNVRKEKIEKIVKEVNYNGSMTVQKFGLRVDDKFAQIPARILDAPRLEYSGGKTIQPKLGIWRPDNMPFITSMNATQWGVLVLDERTREPAVNDFCRKIIQVAKTVSMNFNESSFNRFLFLNGRQRVQDHQIDIALKEIKAAGMQVLFCVIPDRGDSYARVKQAAELRCGVLTQCIKATTLIKKGTDQSTIANILLKVNAKLNGTNHKLNTTPVLNENCMVIGADVTHPSPDQSHIPSVVGVTASCDQFAFRHSMSWRLQDPRIEMIMDFQNIIEEKLRIYKSKRGKLPEKLLYYRDGVSEGQFQELLSIELNAMRKACQSVDPENGKKVKITMVVVQKRHHTRFFPGQSGIGDSRNNNVPAGTIVDTEITHPNEWQFYLVSHQSIQGVARPTKYCVLHDDSNISVDDLQAFTYNLCHLFTRCNRSVSYPAPTYYAHLVAARGKAYIDGQNIDMNRLANEYGRRQIQQNIVEDHAMFFV